jgi:FMN-dependent NADH-azoreductase
VTIDNLNVWEEGLPEFDGEAIGAKYKGVAKEAMSAAESAIWRSIQSLATRFFYRACDAAYSIRSATSFGLET